MLKQSFNLFFKKPLSDLQKLIFHYLIFLSNLFTDFLFLRNLSGISDDDLLKQTFKIFKLLILVIILNISIHEAVYEKNSDIFREICSETVYLFFFYCSFLLNYYLGRFYTKITSNSIHEVLISRVWIILMFIITIIFQASGSINIKLIDKEAFENMIIDESATAWIILGILGGVQIIRLILTKRIKWYDTFFYTFIYCLFALQMIIQALLNQWLLTFKF